MRHTEFAPVSRLDVEWSPAGEPSSHWRPGDVLLTHGDSLFNRLTQLGQGLRIHGADRTYTWFTHAALVVGEHGELVEVTGSGIATANASKYQPKDYAVVHTGAQPDDVKQIIDFAEWALRERSHYGWLTIASIALTCLTGAKFRFFVDGEFICSGFVARAAERTGAIFSRDPAHVTPADLAKYYRVTPPSPRAPR